MVRVKVQKDQEIQCIEVSGHAGSGEYGFDLVCAEVSAISVGMLNAIDELCPDSCQLKMQEGYVSISVNQSSETLQTILNTFVIQLKTVEYTNQSFITIKER